MNECVENEVDDSAGCVVELLTVSHCICVVAAAGGCIVAAGSGCVVAGSGCVVIGGIGLVLGVDTLEELGV